MLTDSMQSHGAQMLANKIERYWRGRGYAGISAWVEPIKTYIDECDSVRRVYQVRSNIGPNGYPPRAAAAKAA